MTKQPMCTWDGEQWTTPEHLRDCRSSSCRGCRPCGKDHCALGGRCPQHVKHEAGIITCPRCIGKARRRLESIVDLYALDLPAEAEAAGVDSEALNLVGPAAAPAQWAEKHRRVEEHYTGRGWCDWPRTEAFAPDDPHHPYAVLGRWEMALREEYGPPTQLIITVSSAANYLRGLLAGQFPHTREFEEFASEIARCLTHLEAAIHNSRAPEVGRPCPRCCEEYGKGARLEKRYAVHPGLPAGQCCAAPEDTCRTCTGRDDTWHCPDVPEHWWADEDYRAKVDADYLEHAPELPARELAERLSVRISTVRSWTTRRWDDITGEWLPPRLVSRRSAPDGRKLYRVAEAEELRQREETAA